MGVILIVDDERHWQQTLEMLLTSEGHYVEVAQVCAEALTKLQRRKYDLAIIDLKLNNSSVRETLDGFDLVTEAHKRWLPVIIVTGYGTRELRRECFVTFHAFDFFEKQDFDSNRFLECVKRALAERPVDQSRGQRPTEEEPSASQPWIDMVRLHAAGVVESVIGAIAFAFLAYVVSSITGWFPTYQLLFVVLTFFVVIAVSVGYVIWRSKKR